VQHGHANAAHCGALMVLGLIVAYLPPPPLMLYQMDLKYSPDDIVAASSLQTLTVITPLLFQVGSSDENKLLLVHI